MSYNPDMVIESFSADTTLSEFNELALIDATSGVVNITLPDPTEGLNIYVKKMDASANAVNIIAPSGLIDGLTSQSISSQYGVIEIMSDGTNYFVIN